MASLVRALTIVLLLAAAASPGAAQPSFPDRPIKILVPYGPGGATDIVARLIGEEMRETLGQPIIIENKPGAVGVIALEEMMRAKPDGHTLMAGNLTTNAVGPLVYAARLSFNYSRKVATISPLASTPTLLLATTKEFDVASVAALVVRARQNPARLRYSSLGVGSFPHYDMEMFMQSAGIEMTHVPGKAGPADVLRDLAAGDVHIAYFNAPSSLPLIRDGRIRPIAAIGETRLPEYSDVPTMEEQGYAGIGSELWNGLFASADTPPEILRRLHAAVSDALASPRVQDAFKKTGMRALRTQSLEEADAWLKRELEKWRDIVARVKIEQ